MDQQAAAPGGSDPDFLIEGVPFDCYSPVTSNPGTIAHELERKVQRGQANRIVLNLADSSASVASVRAELLERPIPGLLEVIAIDQESQIVHLHP